MNKLYLILGFLLACVAVEASTNRVWVLTVPEGTTATGIGGVDTTRSYTYSDGTTQSVDDLIVRGDLDVRGTMNVATQNVTGTFLNSSNDMAVSFMGYPKVSIPASDISMVVYSGTVMATNQFSYIVDSSINTYGVRTNFSGTASAKLTIALPAFYVGYAVLTWSGTNFGTGNEALYYGFGGTPEPTNNFTHLTGDFLGGAGGTPVAQARIACHTVNDAKLYQAIRPFAGKGVVVEADGGSATAVIQYRDISIYATTNGYRNLGGL